MVEKARLDTYRSEVQEELGEILSFWTEHAIDEQYGGFVGALTNELEILEEEPKSLVMYTRLVWTFSKAARSLEEPKYLEFAQRALDFLKDHFLDDVHGGALWMVDARAEPLDPAKKVYGQAFFIYALAEHSLATEDEESLELAKRLYRIIEEEAHDSTAVGYLENFTQAWKSVGAGVLDPEDKVAAEKTMNSHLHILEAYTNLYRVWKMPHVADNVRELINVFLDKIIDPETGHFLLFFDREWNPLPSYESYGHDIEGSWLLCEAAEVLGDEDLLSEVEEIALEMAGATLRDGVDKDGGIFYEGEEGQIIDADKHWWPQAEGMVGFLNAYQLSGSPQFFDASIACWDFAKNFIVDRQRGGWYRRVSRDGEPYTEENKIGPWKSPYHNSRACFEVIERLEKIAAEEPGD